MFTKVLKKVREELEPIGWFISSCVLMVLLFLAAYASGCEKDYLE